MSNIINSEAYVKQGDKVYKVNGGAPIHTFNSVEEMNAANLADGSIACVPSTGGGGGLPVVELTTVATEEGAPLTEEENDLMDALAAKNMPFVLKANDGNTYATGVANCMSFTPDSAFAYSFQVYDTLFMVMKPEDGWALARINV